MAFTWIAVEDLRKETCTERGCTGGVAVMSATVVQFPDGGAHPTAPLSEADERVIALLRRRLTVERECAWSRS
jgi:hypothetical protein